MARSLALLLALLAASISFCQSLTGLTVAPAAVPAGTGATGTVTISAPAAAGGFTVALSSDNAAANVGANVVVPTGATSATFPITTHNSGYTDIVATITGSDGTVNKAAALKVRPANYSSFVGQMVPSTMVSGQTYTVSVQFKNTGGTTWDATHFFKLQSRNPADNLTWGTKRLRLTNAPVAPGQTGTFSGPVIAPLTAGTFNFQWECIQDDIYDPFGPASANVAVTTTVAVDAAQFLGQTGVPSSIQTGVAFAPNIKFKNVGTASWTAAAGYVLKSRNPYANTFWGTSTVALPSSVAPGASVTFTPNLVAPATPGTYAFQWSMIHASGFGDVPASVNVIVTSPDNAQFVSQSIGTSMYTGQQFWPLYTFKNTGTTTWINTSGYWSVAVNPLLNTTWTLPRGYLPYNLPVVPGQTVSIVPHVTAPSTPGTYTMQWQMAKSDVPFGQPTKAINIVVFALGPESAVCTAQTIPIAATAGQHYIAQVTFKNNGTADWPLNTAIAPYPAFDGTWALKYLPTGSVITVGNSRTYTLDLVAPYKAGNYPLIFRMRDMNTNSWFGEWTSAVTVVVSPGPYAQSPWPGYLGGRYRQSGRGFGSGATGTEKWASDLGFYTNSSPAIGSDGTIYIATNNDKLYAFDPSTGGQKWVFTVSDPDNDMISSPAVGADGTVLIGSDNGNVYAVNGSTGTEKWAFKTGGFVTGSPVFGPDGTVYIGSWDDKMYALDGSTGALKWSFTTGDNIWGSAAIGSDGTVYFGSRDGNVYALDGTTGAEKWSFATGHTIEGTPSVGADGTVYAGDQNLFAIDPVTGNKKWSIFVFGGVYSGAATGSDGTLYFTNGSGVILAVNGSTGSQLWSFKTGVSGAFATPTVGADGTVYVGTNSKNLYALDGSSGTLKWSFATGGSVGTSPAIDSDGTIYFGSGDGFLYAIK